MNVFPKLRREEVGVLQKIPENHQSINQLIDNSIHILCEDERECSPLVKDKKRKLNEANMLNESKKADGLSFRVRELLGRTSSQ